MFVQIFYWNTSWSVLITYNPNLFGDDQTTTDVLLSVRLKGKKYEGHWERINNQGKLKVGTKKWIICRYK
jgi:hypothetical protein